MEDEFCAIVDIYGVPVPKHRNYYMDEWSRDLLFTCKVCVNPFEGGTDTLNIRLKSLSDDSVIATAPYDGQHGINSVADSARHYVFIVRNPSMHAWLGVKFQSAQDSTLFSLAIQKFMQRRMCETAGFNAWKMLPGRVQHSGAA